MANWLDESLWQSLCNGEACPICLAGPKDVVAELATSWVTAAERAPLPGYAAVVYKRHVVEPFELHPADGAAFWNDVMIAAKIIADLFRPIQMNYEIHGNTVPHLHAHLFPRSRDDPFLGDPIDGRRQTFKRSAEDLERIGRAFKASGSGRL